MDIEKIDLDALAADLDALQAELRAGVGEADLRHLKKVEAMGRAASLIGYGTAWLAPNPISALLMSQGTFTRWAMMGHHVLHRGYDKVPGVPHRYTSKGFAKGWRRYIDWLDWIEPDAWVHEHNFQHHYKLGESQDPDQPELNTQTLRDSGLPLALRYGLVAAIASTWKYSYYAPNTMGEYDRHRRKVKSEEGERFSLADWAVWSPKGTPGKLVWTQCFLPYAGVKFGLLPLLFLPLGPWAYASVMANTAMAELFTNLQGFLMIVPNHAGDDVYAFEEPIKDKKEFYLRQILGSVNYKTGSDLTDMVHGWLNYQIEHHLWPDMTMLQYKKAQPRVKAICEKHGLPYIQESVFKRLGKLTDVMVGKGKLRRFPRRRKKEATSTEALAS